MIKYNARMASSMHEFLCMTYKHVCWFRLCNLYKHDGVSFDKVYILHPKCVKAEKGSCILTVSGEESMMKAWLIERL